MSGVEMRQGGVKGQKNHLVTLPLHIWNPKWDKKACDQIQNNGIIIPDRSEDKEAYYQSLIEVTTLVFILPSSFSIR